MSYHGALTAAHAARKRRLQQQLDEKEEVEMTNYTQDDLDSNWEFKIVRASTRKFEDPEFFLKTCEEEARAG